MDIINYNEYEQLLNEIIENNKIILCNKNEFGTAYDIINKVYY